LRKEGQAIFCINQWSPTLFLLIWQNKNMINLLKNWMWPKETFSKRQKCCFTLITSGQFLLLQLSKWENISRMLLKITMSQILKSMQQLISNMPSIENMGDQTYLRFFKNRRFQVLRIIMKYCSDLMTHLRIRTVILIQFTSKMPFRQSFI